MLTRAWGNHASFLHRNMTANTRGGVTFGYTAQFGDMTRGPRIVNPETKAEMKRILDEIQTGQFAKEWILENKANRPSFNALAKRDNDHLIEVVGRELRGMMSWMKKPATATAQTEVPVQQAVQTKIEL